MNPEELDFGFHYPVNYLSKHAWFLVRSNFVFGWPRPGGLDDQCEFFVRDVMLWCDLQAATRKDGTDPDRQDGGDLFRGVAESEVVRTKGW